MSEEETEVEEATEEVPDEKEPVDEEGERFNAEAGDAYDKAMAGEEEPPALGEQPPGDPEATPPEKPEEGKSEETPAQTPEVPAEQPPEAEAIAPAMTPEQMQQRETELNTHAEDLTQRTTQYNEAVKQYEQIVNGPEWEQFQQYLQEKGQPNAAGQPGQPEQGAPDALAEFAHDTPNEEVLVGAIRADRERFQQYQDITDQRVHDLHQRVLKYEEFEAKQAKETADREIDGVLVGLKEQYPDLVDGGDNQDALAVEAALQIKASMMGGGEPITLQKAMEKAAILLSQDTTDDRARRQVEQKAVAARNLAVESPTRTTPDSAKGWDDLVGDAYDEAMAGQT